MIPGICALLYPRSGSPTGSFSAITDTPYVSVQGQGSISTPAITAMPIGGVAPYTYAWTYYGGDASMTINSAATSATTGTLDIRDGDYTQTQVICTITDNTGAKAETGVCNFTFVWQG